MLFCTNLVGGANLCSLLPSPASSEPMLRVRPPGSDLRRRVGRVHALSMVAPSSRSMRPCGAKYGSNADDSCREMSNDRGNSVDAARKDRRRPDIWTTLSGGRASQDAKRG